MKKEDVSIAWNYFLFAVYIILFVSIVFSFRAISSISIGLILLSGLISNKYFDRSSVAKRSFLLFLTGCCLLFILQSCALLFTKNFFEGWKLLQRNSGLIFIPCALLASHKFLKPETMRKLLFYFAVILSIASLFCLTVSSIKYLSGAPSTIFFYHDLVKPLSQHAIQFSILVFIALISLFENLTEKKFMSTIFFLKPMIFFLSFFLILLSSKLIIAFYIFYLLNFFLREQFNGNKRFIIVSAVVGITVLIILTPNPVGNRFHSIFTGNYMLFTQKKFNQGIYFNGLQFRLLQWRFTNEILNEQHAWLAGVTPGDAQSQLDKKYIKTNMYTGVPGSEKHGFLGYHTHNQFLQVTLENGLPGLLILLFICYALLKMAGRNKQLKWLIVLLLTYCFTDAPLATQYGLIIFSFFPAFIYLGGRQSNKQRKSPEPFASGVQKDLFEITSIKQPN